jgi:hypothetical protein
VQLDVAADLALAALLLLTAGWCALVHQRLRRLRTERGEMEAFIATLAAATERAEVATGGLRDAVAEAGRGLREQEEAARQRASDLARQVESGTRVLRRLETAVLQGARSLAEQGMARERPEPVAHVQAAAVEPRERPAVGARASARAEATRAPAFAQGGGGLSTDELMKALGSLR